MADPQKPPALVSLAWVHKAAKTSSAKSEKVRP